MLHQPYKRPPFPEMMLGQIGPYTKRFRDMMTEVYDLTGEFLVQSEVEQVARIAAKAFQASGGIDIHVLEASLSSEIGKEITGEWLHTMGHRFAANRDRLKQDGTIHAWNGYIAPDTWTAIEFKDVRTDGKGVVRLIGDVIWGPVVDHQVIKDVSINDNGLWNLMHSVLGKKHSGNPREMVKLRCFVQLHIKFGTTQLSFSQATTDKKLDAYNAKLRKLRREPCHNRYTWPCAQCPLGFEDCVRACRPVTLTVNGFTPPLKTEKVQDVLQMRIPKSGVASQSAGGQMVWHSPGRDIAHCFADLCSKVDDLLGDTETNLTLWLQYQGGSEEDRRQIAKFMVAYIHQVTGGPEGKTKAATQKEALLNAGYMELPTRLKLAGGWAWMLVMLSFYFRGYRECVSGAQAAEPLGVHEIEKLTSGDPFYRRWVKYLKAEWTLLKQWYQSKATS